MIGHLIRKSIALEAVDPKHERQYIGISQVPYCNLKLYNRHYKRHALAACHADEALYCRFFQSRALHQAMSSLLKEYGARVLPEYTYLHSEGEVSFDVGTYVLKGHYDHVCLIGGTKVVIDYKFVNYLGRIEVPDQHYLDQLYLYAHGVSAKEVILIYLDNRSLVSKEYRRTVDPDRLRYLMKKYAHLMQCIDTKSPPQKPYRSPHESWECRYCEYQTLCWPKSQLSRPSKAFSNRRYKQATRTQPPAFLRRHAYALRSS